MIKVYSSHNKEKWCNIITSFPDYDVYYLPQYTRALALHGDGEPFLYYYDGQGLRAANVVLRRDIATDKLFGGYIDKGTFFDQCTPYGYGGWIFAGEVSEEEIDNLCHAYEAYCRAEGMVSEFVRFHPLMGSDILCAKLYEIVTHGPLVYMDISSPDIIWKNLTKSKRNRIRKAMNSSVTVHYGLDARLLERFQELYNRTMERNKAEQYYFFGKEFYDSILSDLKDHALVFYAAKDGVVIAADIVIMAGQRMNSHLGASELEYNEFQPQTLLTYHEALWGFEHGYKTLLLGGGLGSKEDSIYQFKKRFNKNSHLVFKTVRKIFNQYIYQELCAMRNMSRGNAILDKSYFPLYRAKAIAPPLDPALTGAES